LEVLKSSNDVEIKKKVKEILNRAENIQTLMKKLNYRRYSKEKRKDFLTDKEIEVLRESSVINEKLYLPWIDHVDRNEVLIDELKIFQDPDGILSLSEQQKKHFYSWRRPHEIMKDPKIISTLNVENVTQNIVSDCSFVASLIVAAIFESKYQKKLISNLIFPQNISGEPIYNPSGKYAIKLFFNGIQRKVIIDDYFPTDIYDNLLTSYSENELWICLLEKAYMKLNGGYSFQGSNSGIDLHCLTGWIGEEILIKSNQFQAETTWKRLISGYTFGDCLITISTGDIDSKISQEIGLFSNHAYGLFSFFLTPKLYWM
jgi:calpain-7